MSIAAVESAQIVMDPAQAKAKARALRKLDDKHKTDEHRALLSVLNKLGADARVIDINQVIQAGGIDDAGRPRLAIARADQREVYFYWQSSSQQARFITGDMNYRYEKTITNRPGTLVREVDMGQQTEIAAHRSAGFADVPLVPAEHHPGCDLRLRFVLWEVDEWRDLSRTAKPSVDPYLVKHLHGSLYTIEAEWDLTELEMAIIGGVRSNQNRGG